MSRRITVETPVGEIVSRFNGNEEFPGLEIRIVTKDNPTGVVVAAVEWDRGAGRLNVMHWKSLVNDDSEPVVTRIPKARAIGQLAQNRSK